MSRLDKIFILLETGSNPQTRKLAATQIGEVGYIHYFMHDTLTYIFTTNILKGL